jgi:2-oxoisovalerate dehydrogenase E1 component alpha subunit
MTYRQGHHSTSDDSFRYRSAKEVHSFADSHDPIARLQKFMLRHGQLTEVDFAAIENREKMAVIGAMRDAERKPKPPLEALFTDVYHELPPSLIEQQSKLNDHLRKYPKEYQL